MSRKDFIQQLHIDAPCSVEWDSMIGNDRVRFCEHCRLSVHHVDSLSRKQLRRLIARSHGRLCVNYTRPYATEPVFPILHKIGRRTSALARSEEHTSELQSRGLISYAVFCLK